MTKLLRLATIVACISSIFFLSSIFNVASAHSIPSGITTKRTKIVSMSDYVCNNLLKSDSSLTKADCTITLTSTTIKSATFLAPNACPSGDVNHTVDDAGLTWHVELSTIFHFPGNCTRPSVSYTSCLNNMYAFWPFGISNATCSTFTLDANRLMSEGIWNVSGVLGAGSYTVTVQSIANNNGTISDASN